MSFDSRWFNRRPGEVVHRDRFCEVEMATTFKEITCSRCDFVSIYKFRAQHVRRLKEIEVQEGEEIRPDHEYIWRSIPRFAEIPETIKCKRCGEVLGAYTRCIFK